MTTATAELTEIERSMLQFSKLSWRYEGQREAAILERFGMSRTLFDFRINRLIDTVAAEAAEPVVVHRLQRIRASRQRSRSVRRS